MLLTTLVIPRLFRAIEPDHIDVQSRRVQENYCCGSFSRHAGRTFIDRCSAGRVIPTLLEAEVYEQVAAAALQSGHAERPVGMTLMPINLRTV